MLIANLDAVVLHHFMVLTAVETYFKVNVIMSFRSVPVAARSKA